MICQFRFNSKWGVTTCNKEALDGETLCKFHFFLGYAKQRKKGDKHNKKPGQRKRIAIS